MTQKNNISAVVISICSALTLSACVVKKKDDTKPTGTYSEEYCRGQKKAYDSANKVCTAPDLAFCATLMMVKGTSACRAPANQNDCKALGGALNKTLHWNNNECGDATSTAGQGKLDRTIRIAWQGKRTVQGAQRAYVDIGHVTVTPSKNDHHQINMLKKAGSTCELLRTSVSGRTFKVKVKGPASTCEGQILVINTKTGDYNVEEFSVTIN